MCLKNILLLVSFYTPAVENIKEIHIEAINKSKFNAVAVPWIAQFDTTDIELNDLTKHADLAFSSSSKIVPWVYFNRFVGVNKKGDIRHLRSDQSYFRNIRGIDLSSESTGFIDFKKAFRSALKYSKKSKENILILDPEFYNNYSAYNLSLLSKELGMPVEELIVRLESMGREMARIIESENPTVELLLLFSGITGGRVGLGDKPEDYERSVTYIIKGLVKEIQGREIPATVVSGGELTMGYCAVDSEDLRNIVRERSLRLERARAVFPQLVHGATIAPWVHQDVKKSWMLRGRCGRSVIENLNEFEEPLSFLRSNYQYVWVYGAVAGGINLYLDTVRNDLNRLIENTSVGHEGCR